MDLRLETIQIKQKQLFSIGTFFGMILLISCNQVVDTSIGFILPFVIVAFCCGYRYVICYYLALLMSCLLLQTNQTIVVAAISVGVLFQIASILKITNYLYMPLVTTSVVVFYLSIFLYDPFVILLTGGLTLFHSFLYMELIPLFIHQTIDTYRKQRIIVVTMVIMQCVIVLTSFSTFYTMLLLRYYVLLSIFYLGMQMTIPSIIYISILLLMQNHGLKEDVLAILLPCFIYFIYLPKSKVECGMIYIISHIFLPFFITYEYYTHGFVIIGSACLFMVTPKLPFYKEITTDNFKQETVKNKVLQKTETFAGLFKQLTKVFQESHQTLPVKTYTNYIYEDVCSTCTSKHTCYKNQEPSRLVKLATKGVKEGLQKEDTQYIQTYCVQPRKYLYSITNYKDSYMRDRGIQNVNKSMQDDLFEQFSLLSEVFTDFQKGLPYVTHNQEDMKEHLLGFQFDIRYLRKYQVSNQSYYIEIGVLTGNQREIEEELIPILQNYIQDTLQIVSIKENLPYLGYSSVIVKHEIQHVLQYGFQQMSCTTSVCGDSQCVFQQDTKHYFALSDGMGHGSLASKESKLTVDLLSKLIRNGVNLKDTLNSINALLRIKNKNDMFTTLDLCCIDVSNGQAKFVKYGAHPSYIYHQGITEQISGQSLPVGIQKDVTMSTKTVHLQHNDIIVLTTDGVQPGFQSILKETLPALKFEHAQTIATRLMEEVVKKEIQDDTSILVIKIQTI